jgi:predicted nuclease of predicted toxin-antitoxin system
VKVLLDSCISGQAAEVVRQAGHDVTWAGGWPRDPGDEEILRRAAAESRVLATIDKDFGELVIVQGMINVGLIRLVDFRSRDQGPALVRLLSTYEAELAEGAILTAEPWRVRVRPGTRSVPDQRHGAAKIENLAIKFTGEIPPEDIGDGWIRGTKWPVEFSLVVDARFDQPVAAESASLEIVRENGGQRVARIVKSIDRPVGGATIQQWRGTFESVSISEPGNYQIVIHVDGVKPELLRWRIDRKEPQQ